MTQFHIIVRLRFLWNHLSDTLHLARMIDIKMTYFQTAAFLIFLSLIQTYSASYNSTTVCLAGNNQMTHFEASCLMNSTNERRIIAVTNVFYGAKPDIYRCQDTDNSTECCSRGEQDCFFGNKPGQIPYNIMAACSGEQSCFTDQTPRRTYSCPEPADFLESSKTTYGYVQFDCINAGLLEDMCHDGTIKTGQELYLASNVYYGNSEHANKTCTCIMTTSCGAAIQVDAVDIRFDSLDPCGEELHFSDKTSTNRTVPCSEGGLNGYKPIYTSNYSTARLDMVIRGKHRGKLWIKVSSTRENATVQLRCGAATQWDPTEDEHKCPGDVKPTTTTTTTTTTITTTNKTPSTTNELTTTEQEDCKPGTHDCSPTSEDLQDSLPQGAIIGIIIAGVIILIVIVFILTLVFRRHRRPADHDYDIPAPRTPDYDILRYHNPTSKPPNDVNGYTNPSYDNSEMEKNGAVGRPPSDYEQLNHATLNNYDNEVNDSVMVMPNGAVM